MARAGVEPMAAGDVERRRPHAAPLVSTPRPRGFKGSAGQRLSSGPLGGMRSEDRTGPDPGDHQAGQDRLRREKVSEWKDEQWPSVSR